MKTSVVFILIFIFLSACKKNNTSTTGITDPVNPAAMVLAKGDFTGSGGHVVNGSAEVINDNNQKQLVLKGFSTVNGPDLKVYIATTIQASNFISLGALKSTNGQQVYDISGMPDFAQYKFVLIWCRQFSVLFGSAELK